MASDEISILVVEDEPAIAELIAFFSQIRGLASGNGFFR